MNLDGLAHVDFVKAQHASTHHAVLKLLADGVGGVKETRQAVDQASVSSRVDGSVARSHTSSRFVEFLLRLQQNQSGSRRNARSTNGVEDCLVSICNVSVDAGGQLRDTGLENPLCKVVQLQSQLSGGEVHTDVLLACYRQRGALLGIVLHLQGCTVSHQRPIRQANTQGRANFCTTNSKAVVVLSVHVAGEY